MTVSAAFAVPRTERPFSSFCERASALAGRAETCGLAVSPYRFNPLGAHVDHQGGPVLARTHDPYTLLAFWPSDAASVQLKFDTGAGGADECCFAIEPAGGDASCASSIDNHESGSEWLVMLVERDAAPAIARVLLERYLDRYPDKLGLARCFVATAEAGARLA